MKAEIFSNAMFFNNFVDHKRHAHFQMMYSIETANAIIQNLIIKTLDFHFLCLCHGGKAPVALVFVHWSVLYCMYLK